MFALSALMLPEVDALLLLLFVLVFVVLEYEPFVDAGAVVPVVVVSLYTPVLVDAGVDDVISVLDRVE